MSTTRIIRTYTELSRLRTFEERYAYLRLNGQVGRETFGFDRIFNQMFYQHSDEWKSVRDYVIVRDNGCDLGIPEHKIGEGVRIYVHHMNPISMDDITNATDFLLNPEYLITTIHNTHQAIHYGNEDLLVTAPIVRSMNDTCPWRK